MERVSTTAADGVPRGLAGRSQTIDVYGSPAITSGGFRLAYGGSADSINVITSSCIPANTTSLTAEAISEALHSANEFLNVTVAEDDPPFDNARRFVVYFEAPELGVAVLSVVDEEEEDCEWLQCSDGDEDEDGQCDDAGVVINRDLSVFVEDGAVEVSLWSLEFRVSCRSLCGVNIHICFVFL